MLDKQIPPAVPVAPADLDPAVSAVPPTVGSRLRGVAVGALSLLVVLGGVFYVAAPSQPTLESTFSEVSSAPAYDLDLGVDYSLAAATVAERRRFRQTIYGAVSSPSGIPVTGARLDIRGATKKLRAQRATAAIGGTGTYRAVVRLRPGLYRLTLRLRADGRLREVSTTQRLRDQRAYLFSVKVRESGIVTMLPISSY